MKKLKIQMVRLFSHILKGRLGEKYREEWLKYKALKQKESISFLVSEIEFIKKYISYKRVPGFDKEPMPVYNYINNIIQCSVLHQQAFEDKRCLNFGKDVVICATGPTFENYEAFENAYHIGLNNAYKRKDICFDVLFCQDAYTVFGGKVPVDFISYRGKDCLKFLGNSQPVAGGVNISENNVLYYISENQFNYHINTRALPDFCSVVFSAFAFALWTTPKRIYIVGADCSSGHAKDIDANHNVDCSNLVYAWKKMKDFANRFYPDIEIISINPVGLKGLFKDAYTT